MAAAEQLLSALRRTPPKGGGTPSAIHDLVQEWKGMGDKMLNSLMDSFSDIESREENVRVVGELLETRLRDLEERESEFKVLKEGKSEELRLREEKLDEQLKLVHEHIESLETSQGEVEVLRVKNCEKLKEIEKRERELDGVNTWLLEKRLSGFEKREKELEALYDGKFKELSLKEELLVKEKEEFVEEVKFTNEKLKEKQKLGCGLIERLEMALDMLGGMKVLMDEKFKEIESRETMAHESLTSRLNEAELIRESLEKRFKELEDIEKGIVFSQDKTRLGSNEGQLVTVGRDNDMVNSREEEVTQRQKLGPQRLENKPEEKEQELGLKHGILVSCKKEHSYEERDLEEGECSEKSLSSVRESPQNYIKENLALGKLDQPQRHVIGSDAGLVADKGQQACRLGEVALKQSMLTDTTSARVTIKQEKSVDLRVAQQKDQEALEMLINDPKKDLESIDNEIYKILLLSSDPAKVVLDVVDGFHALRSEKLDTECRVKRATILLLDQLTKMSPKIQPCVIEAAIKLALEWKSKMSTTAENPMEILGFLRLLAAYNLSSHFDKNELFSFLKLAAQHKQAPDLCHALGLTEKIPGIILSPVVLQFCYMNMARLIQKLINEKQYLLASTYISEYQLQHKFPQAGILNYYVTHSKLSANAKCRSERNSPEAQDKAIASELADLCIAIEHIVKYGLESDYSTNALTARIKQLEVNRESLRHGRPIPTTAAADGSQRCGRGNKRKERRRALRAERQSAAVLTPQITGHGSNSWSCPGWSEMPPAEAAPLGFPYQWRCVNLVPMPQHMAVSPYKRRKTKAWYNGQQQFGN
ncbi:hypothetical protein C2S51_025303 [Perilla frutescens var. frutescens]|nr:hypothetical protein C2S51_025303 [Perilla frutescens var. frutescens]